MSMTNKEIWDFLLSKTKNKFGTAAIMGNLMAESSLNPKNAAGLKKTSYTNVDQYILASDDGVHDFVHDGVAFGFVQWCYYSRKQGFYNYVQSKSGSVANAKLQLEYLIKEMSESYKTVWTAVTEAVSIRSASDVVMLKYEKPSNTSEAMRQKRADYGQKYYDLFASSDLPDNPGKNEPISSPKKVIVTKDRVNLRAGNGTNFSRISQVNKNAMYEWVATSENGWYAIKIPGKVVWVSSEFSKLTN